MSDLDRQIELLRKCECIKESEVKLLCAKAREILVEESNVQRVDAPVTVLFFFYLNLFKLRYAGIYMANFSICWSYLKKGETAQIPIIYF